MVMDLEETEAGMTVLLKTNSNLTDRPTDRPTDGELLGLSRCELLLLEAGS
jgi:hypothetical protein